jgi:hypothetical protein
VWQANKPHTTAMEIVDILPTDHQYPKHWDCFHDSFVSG